MNQRFWRRLMSRGIKPAVMALIAASALSTWAQAEGRVRLDLGVRSMQGRAWDGMELQASEGVSIDYGRAGWPVEIAFGLHVSEAEMMESTFAPDGGGYCIIPFFFCFLTGETVERTVARSSFRELSVGVDKFWGRPGSKVRGYIGGGPAFMKATISVAEPAVEARDSSAGLWARAGILGVAPRDSRVQLNWGFEVRALQATSLSLGRVSADADYLQLGFIAGVGW